MSSVVLSASRQTGREPICESGVPTGHPSFGVAGLPCNNENSRTLGGRRAMTLVVELSEDQARRLRAASRQHGVEAEEYARHLLDRLASEDSDEAWEADLDALAQGSRDLPVLSRKATSREHIYEDRG